MQFAEPPLELGEARASRLDDDLTLGFAIHAPLPSVRRAHRRVNVHARGNPLRDERARELIRARIVFAGGHRGENDDEIAHFSSCTFDRVVVMSSRVPKDEAQPAPKRKISRPARPTRKKRGFVHVLLLFVASLIVLDGLVGDRGLLAMLRARQEYDELAATIARQRGENAR